MERSLLTIDVWGHACDVDFRNRRPDDIDAFLAHLYQDLSPRQRPCRLAPPVQRGLSSTRRSTGKSAGDP